jgi:hypothetical protein
VQQAFEAQAHADLSRFFRQWVQMAGAPLLMVTDARRISVSDHTIALELKQEATDYELSVPLRIHHEAGTTEVNVMMARAQLRSEIALPARALYVEIDPDVRLFRRLHPEEIAPTLRQVMLHPDAQVALAASTASARAAALRVAAAALESGVRLLEADSTQIRTPLLVVGLQAELAPLLARLGLPHRAVPGAESAAAYAYAWRTSDGIAFSVVSAADAEQLAALARSLPHLGAQSYAVFAGSRSSARGVWQVGARRYPVRDGLP